MKKYIFLSVALMVSLMAQSAVFSTISSKLSSYKMDVFENDDWWVCMTNNEIKTKLQKDNSGAVGLMAAANNDDAPLIGFNFIGDNFALASFAATLDGDVNKSVTITFDNTVEVTFDATFSKSAADEAGQHHYNFSVEISTSKSTSCNYMGYKYFKPNMCVGYILNLFSTSKVAVVTFDNCQIKFTQSSYKTFGEMFKILDEKETNIDSYFNAYKNRK